MECIGCKSFEHTDLPLGTKVKCFICGKTLVKGDKIRQFAEMFGGMDENNPFADLFNKK